jgi:hypothetical protein
MPNRSLMALAGLVSGPVTAAHSGTWLRGRNRLFVTLLAYTSSGEGQKIYPVVAYYYFNACPLIGEFHETSTEVVLGERFEVGYTHDFQNEGEIRLLVHFGRTDLKSLTAKLFLFRNTARKN